LLLAASAAVAAAVIFGWRQRNGANNTGAVATGGVDNSASGVYSSVVGGLRNKPRQYCAVAVGGKRQRYGENLLFSAAQIMRPTILPRLLLAGHNSSGVYSSVVGGLMKPTIPQWLLAVSATLPVAITLLFSAAQIMRPTALDGLLLAVSITLPVVCTHPWSAACAINTNTTSLVGGVRNVANYSAVFGGTQIRPSNTAAFATGGIRNSASGRFSSVVGGVVKGQQ
jgi:hypothetical protein